MNRKQALSLLADALTALTLLALPVLLKLLADPA